MDLRRLLLVVLVIVVVLASSFFLLGYDETVKYTRVGLTNTSSLEIPISDDSTNNVVNGINVINDTKHDLTVMYFNSAEGNQVAAVELDYIRNDFIGNSVQETLANQTIWHNEENGTYMGFIGNYVTHDNILIICKDPAMLEHMIASAQYQYFNEETNSTETYRGDNQTDEQGNNLSADNTGVDSTGVDNTGVNNAPTDSTGTGQGQSNTSSTDVPDGYYWSGQESDYIREYDDANGVHHIDRRNGPNEAIDTVNNKHYTNGVEDTEAYNKDFN